MSHQRTVLKLAVLKSTSLIRRLLLVPLVLAVPGCQLLGVAANAVPQTPIPAKVVLANHSVGVMVWCDRGLRVDYSSIQKDLGNGVQVRINEAQTAKAKEVLGTTFPYPTESFIRWQRDHPGDEYEPITNIAPRLHVQLLIYVEIDSLSTRAAKTVDLYRGSATATLKVIQVSDDSTTSKIIYEEHNIHVVYPRKSNDEGRPDGSDMKMYVGTMTLLADAIAERFVEHPPEDD